MPTTPVVHTRTHRRSEAVASHGEALDVLSQALTAAEAHFFELNLGVGASIQIRSEPVEQEHGPTGDSYDTRLAWGKVSGKWCLHLQHGMDSDEDTWSTSSLLQASAEIRKLAAHRLTDLLQAVRAQAIREVDEVKAAAEKALAFARGEFDNV